MRKIKIELTIALDIVVDEVSSVRALVGPREASVAVFATLNVGSLVRGTIRPSLQTVSVLLVLFPLATVLGPVQVTVRAEAVRLIIGPHTVVHVAICMDQSALAVGLTVGPVALVQGAVWPNLNSLALPDLGAPEPLSLILCHVLKDDSLAHLAVAQLLLKLDVVEEELAQLLSHFLPHQGLNNVGQNGIQLSTKSDGRWQM